MRLSESRACDGVWGGMRSAGERPRHRAECGRKARVLHGTRLNGGGAARSAGGGEVTYAIAVERGRSLYPPSLAIITSGR